MLLFGYIALNLRIFIGIHCSQPVDIYRYTSYEYLLNNIYYERYSRFSSTTGNLQKLTSLLCREFVFYRTCRLTCRTTTQVGQYVIEQALNQSNLKSQISNLNQNLNYSLKTNVSKFHPNALASLLPQYINFPLSTRLCGVPCGVSMTTFP